MADHLKLDLSALEQLHRDLHSAAVEFRAGDAMSGALGEAVGQDDLKKAVHDFSSGWTKTRATLLDALDKMTSEAGAVHDTFDSLDESIASSVKGE